ncbi:MAG: hypothetical protein ACRDTS_15070 [Mycobacterium sp.]
MRLPAWARVGVAHRLDRHIVWIFCDASAPRGRRAGTALPAGDLRVAAAPAPPEQDRERHAPVFEHLRRVVARGQKEGTIDPGMAPDWIFAAVLALGHAAGEEVRAGRMSSVEAVNALRRDIPRLLRPE